MDKDNNTSIAFKGTNFNKLFIENKEITTPNVNEEQEDEGKTEGREMAEMRTGKRRIDLVGAFARSVECSTSSTCASSAWFWNEIYVQATAFRIFSNRGGVLSQITWELCNR
jgi:hypothetical protein